MESIIDQKRNQGKRFGQEGGAQPREHMAREQILRYRAGELTRGEAAGLLAHAADCDDCALLLAESLLEGEMLAPRANLKGEILEKARRSGDNVIGAQRRFSSRFQMLTYSLKVGTAVAAALIFLFAIPLEPGEPLTQRRDPGMTLAGKLNRITQEISSGALDASNRLVSGEFHYFWDDNKMEGEIR